MEQKVYTSDVSDEEWALVVPYLTLMTEDTPQREYPLREVINGLRWIVRTATQCSIISLRYVKKSIKLRLLFTYKQNSLYYSSGLVLACCIPAKPPNFASAIPGQFSYFDRG